MAMHKKLNIGSILFAYHEPRYNSYRHRDGREKYDIDFKVLYVHNRRERSAGVDVPISLIPTLEKLGIRHENVYRQTDVTCAVGCRTHVYYSCTSSMPYPSPEQIKAARAALEEQLEAETARNQGVTLSEVEFVQKFREKKMTNKDSVFSLLKPLHDYVANEAIVS